MRTTSTWRAVVVCLWAVEAAGAEDIVTMKNGDRLSGRIVSMAQNPTADGQSVGVLDLETAYAGVVHLPLPEIRSIATAGPVDVTLKTGERVKGALKPGEEQQLVVESPGVGTTRRIPFGELAAFNEPPPPKPRWHGFIEAGGTARAGNNDVKTFTLGALAVRETEDDKFSARALFNYGEKEGLRTIRNGFGMAKYDYHLSSRTYVYGSTELFSDEFADLDLRVVAGGGGGVKWLKTPSVQSFFEAGVAYLSENFDTGPDDQRLTGRASLGLNWQILTWLAFEDLAVAYPSFEEEEYLLRNEASLTTTLSTNWSFRVGNVYDYNTDPPGEFGRRDSLWFASVQYRF